MITIQTSINNIVNMKKYIELFKNLLTMLILSTFVLSCNNNNKNTSKDNNENKPFQSSFLSTDNKVLQLGEINNNDTESIPFAFHIKNESDSILVLNKIDVSCSCVEVTDFPKQLGANQSGEICGEINLKNQSGHMRKSIFVNYCDTCIMVLKIVADIID